MSPSLPYSDWRVTMAGKIVRAPTATPTDTDFDADEAPDMTIVQRNRVAPPTFPTDVFGPAKEWVETTAECKCASPDFVALGLLVVASGMIGSKRRVPPWAGWEEPSVLWGALVGEPSCHKSSGNRPNARCRPGYRGRYSTADWVVRQADYETKKKGRRGTPRCLGARSKRRSQGQEVRTSNAATGDGAQGADEASKLDGR